MSLQNELTFSLQFGFRLEYLTAHGLVHLTDEIRNEIDMWDLC